jgi:2,3-bisphosphoglycerate-independent phosphoglycerate mutase
MKRILLLVDGAADFPYPELREQTPLDTARLLHARALATEGRTGLLHRSRAEADASRALLAEACGLPSREALRLRWGPMAAAALGLSSEARRVRMLGQCVTYTSEGEQAPVQLSTEAEESHLFGDLEKAFSDVCGDAVKMVSMGQGRFVLDLPPEFPVPLKDKVGWKPFAILRRQDEPFRRLLQTAETLLLAHPVNAVRLDLGENPVHGVWLWSGGAETPSAVNLPFRQAIAGPERLAKGLALCLGRPFFSIDDPFHLDQPDAGFDVAALMGLLPEIDELVVWIPAPFASDRFAVPEEKVRRLDAVDYYITGPLRALLAECSPRRFLLVAAGLRHRGRPEKGPVPVVLWGDGIPADESTAWSESAAVAGALGSPTFSRLLRQFRDPGPSHLTDRL